MSQTGSPQRDATRSNAVTRAMVVLLICLAGLAALVAADRALRLGLFQEALALQLAAAAEAVMPCPEDEAPVEFVEAVGEAIAVVVPARVAYDRAEAIGLALELDAMRAECERTIARLERLDYLETPPEQLAPAEARVAGLWGVAQERLGDFLTLEPERARVVLAALGWPWLGHGPEPVRAGDFDPPFPGRPAALRHIEPEAWRSLLAEARGKGPWPELSARLAEAYGLADVQLAGLQAYVCRSDVERAFHSPGANRRARRSLQQHAALTPAQWQAALAMAGARELLEAGTFAFPPLIDVLERRPELGVVLLHECVRRTAVHEQALRAAAALGGPRSAAAEETLIALGPFGTEAITAALTRQLLSNEAPLQHVRSAIHAKWPRGSTALEVLGKDPALWRRWYRDAREVL